jgi:transposase
MKVEWKDPADAGRLGDLVAVEANAKQRDRYRVVLIAGAGLGGEPEVDRETIAAAVGRSRQFVDEWVGRYRRGGLDALTPKRQPGAVPKLTDQQQRELADLIDAGPASAEGLAAYNGPILRERIEERFGVLYSLPGLYALLHRLGYNDLMPRPKHPATDPARQEAFKKRVPRAAGGDQSRPPGQAGPDLLPGRGPLRAARDAGARLGAGRFAAAGDPADAVRLPVPVHRRLPGDG